MSTAWTGSRSAAPDAATVAARTSAVFRGWTQHLRGTASSTRRERSIRPKISRIDVDLAELGRFEDFAGRGVPPLDFHAARHARFTSDSAKDTQRRSWRCDSSTWARASPMRAWYSAMRPRGRAPSPPSAARTRAASLSMSVCSARSASVRGRSRSLRDGSATWSVSRSRSSARARRTTAVRRQAVASQPGPSSRGDRARVRT